MVEGTRGMNNQVVDESGRTFEEFVNELFAYERCCECERGPEGHEPWLICGLWFAHCKEES